MPYKDKKKEAAAQKCWRLSHKEYRKNYYIKNREKILLHQSLYDKIYSKTKQGILVHRKASKKYTDNNRLKVIAKKKVARAIEKGIIIKRGICQYCNNTCKTEFHHPDYAKPLNVIELCKLCHTQLHVSLRSRCSSNVSVD